jgi:hypothetical protein
VDKVGWALCKMFFWTYVLHIGCIKVLSYVPFTTSEDGANDNREPPLVKGGCQQGWALNGDGKPPPMKRDQQRQGPHPRQQAPRRQCSLCHPVQPVPSSLLVFRRHCLPCSLSLSWQCSPQCFPVFPRAHHACAGVRPISAGAPPTVACTS